MTQIELAKHLGISSGYLWKIYNGYARPSERMAIRLQDTTAKRPSWWKTAKQADIQKLFNKMMESA